LMYKGDIISYKRINPKILMHEHPDKEAEVYRTIRISRIAKIFVLLEQVAGVAKRK